LVRFFWKAGHMPKEYQLLLCTFVSYVTVAVQSQTGSRKCNVSMNFHTFEKWVAAMPGNLNAESTSWPARTISCCVFRIALLMRKLKMLAIHRASFVRSFIVST